MDKDRADVTDVVESTLSGFSRRRTTAPRWLERSRRQLGAGVLGSLLLLGVAGMTAHGAALAAFVPAADAAESDAAVAGPGGNPDQSDWSEKRRAEYAESLRHDPGAPAAVLVIPALGVQVTVFRGTNRLALNRGAGLVDGTAQPGDDGNVAIAGHRDGFFRPLKDIHTGASIELRTPEGVRRYRVTEILIVDPLDARVLQPTAEPTLTLITCYPFYFEGYAPDRYIVRATAAEQAQPGMALR